MPEEIAEDIEFLNKDPDSQLALNGFDPVAYFKQGKAVPGNSDYVINYGMAMWYFSSPENLQAFQENPEKYIPEFGGLCSWSLHEGVLQAANPECFTIQLGKLYLHFSNEAKDQFETDLMASIQEANHQWLSQQSILQPVPPVTNGMQKKKMMK